MRGSGLRESKMNVTPEGFRAMIYYDFNRKLSFTESHQNLVQAFGVSAPSLSTVTYWFCVFQHGRVDLKDEPRSGRPATGVTPENIEKARSLILEKRQYYSSGNHG
jgi:hypothetical protein